MDEVLDDCVVEDFEPNARYAPTPTATTSTMTTTITAAAAIALTPRVDSGVTCFSRQADSYL